VIEQELLYYRGSLNPSHDDVKDLSDLKVSKNEIIENVAEKILTQEKSVAVTDENNKIVGTVHPSKIIHTVFGGRKNNN